MINFVYLKLFYNGRQFLKSATHVHSTPPTTWAPNIPCPPTHIISLNFIIPITHSPHHVTPPTYPPLHPPCKPQTTNHPLNTRLNLTNHTPLINASYQPLTLYVNEGSQPYTFPNPLDHAHLGHFPLPTLLIPTIGLDHTPNLPPFLQHAFNLPLKSRVPLVGANLLFEGQLIISVPIIRLIYPIQTLVIILTRFLPLLPLHLQ